MRELIASECDYINDLRVCIQVYLKEYRLIESTLGVELANKERELFGNVESLYSFHADQFCAALKSYEQNPEDVGCVFFSFVEQLTVLYTEYILNNEESSAIINSRKSTF